MKATTRISSRNAISDEPGVSEDEHDREAEGGEREQDEDAGHAQV